MGDGGLTYSQLPQPTQPGQVAYQHKQRSCHTYIVDHTDPKGETFRKGKSDVEAESSGGDHPDQRPRKGVDDADKKTTYLWIPALLHDGKIT